MVDDGVHDVTLGEVYRLVTKVDQRLDLITQQMVGRAEYESDQEGTVARFQQQESALRDWKTESSAAHASLGARIDTLAQRAENTEKAQKDNRSKWIFALVMALVGPLASTLVALALRGGP